MQNHLQTHSWPHYLRENKGEISTMRSRSLAAQLQATEASVLENGFSGVFKRYIKGERCDKRS